MSETISVIIPCRTTDVPTETIETLFAQTYKHLEYIIVVDAEERGQSATRNEGIEQSTRSLILFSDYDCRWKPDAVECLYDTLRTEQGALRDRFGWEIGYSFPAYTQILNGAGVLTFGLEPWNWSRLVQSNYITTMSLVDVDVMEDHREDTECSGLYFDERLHRLEDWDLWLRLGQRGVAGVGVGKILFETDVKPGVSYGGMSHEEAERQVRSYRGI